MKVNLLIFIIVFCCSLIGKRYPHHNMAYQCSHFGLLRCPCFGINYPYLSARGSCQDHFYFTINFELVYADTGQCLVPAPDCMYNGCRLKLTECDGSSITKFWHDTGKAIRHRDSGRCLHRYHHGPDDDIIHLWDGCGDHHSNIHVRVLESEGYHCKFIFLFIHRLNFQDSAVK